MDDVKPVVQQDSSSVALTRAIEPTPEALATKFFVLAMLGVFAYITAIIWLLHSAD
jgi:hypothetical protein